MSASWRSGKTPDRSLGESLAELAKISDDELALIVRPHAFPGSFERDMARADDLLFAFERDMEEDS